MLSAESTETVLPQSTESQISVYNVGACKLE